MKKQIKKKYINCIMAFFTPFNVYSIPLYFAYMAASAYHVMSRDVENCIFRHNWIFRHTCMYKLPTLTTQWNCNNFLQIFYSLLDTLRGSFMDVLFLLLAITLSELYEKPKRNKDSVTEKST